MAGSVVETAIYQAIKKFERDCSRIPKLAMQPLFEVINPAKTAKKLGDIQSYHRGLNVVIDTTLTSKVCNDPKDAAMAGKAAEKAESIKRKEYTKNIRIPEKLFIPMVVDNMGGINDEIFRRS